jgi:hypothetical protein
LSEPESDGFQNPRVADVAGFLSQQLDFCLDLLGGGNRCGHRSSSACFTWRTTSQEDEEDNLAVPSSPGWCFETEEWKWPQTVNSNGNAQIVSIFVFGYPR